MHASASTSDLFELCVLAEHCADGCSHRLASASPGRPSSCRDLWRSLRFIACCARAFSSSSLCSRRSASKCCRWRWRRAASWRGVSRRISSRRCARLAARLAARFAVSCAVTCAVTCTASCSASPPSLCLPPWNLLVGFPRLLRRSRRSDCRRSACRSAFCFSTRRRSARRSARRPLRCAP